MKILIISGFLGAGKTTFIKEMSRKIQRDFVVMENEYGETNMDSAFLKGQENLNIWELTEGCICCSTKSDFASSILTIANTLDPEYLIVEPTGVGVLSNVIRNIQQIEYERITLLRPITIVDADCFHRCMNDYPDIYMDQLRSAGTIVISKRSFISREEENQFVSQLKDLAPGVKVQAEHYSHQDISWWKDLLERDLKGNVLEAADQTAPDLETFALKDTSFSGGTDLLCFLEDLVRGEFGSICRAKGIVNSDRLAVRFDVVDTAYSITGFDGEDTSQGVFIGRNIKRNTLRKRLLPQYIPGSSLRLPKRGADRLSTARPANTPT